MLVIFSVYSIGSKDEKQTKQVVAQTISDDSLRIFRMPRVSRSKLRPSTTSTTIIKIVTTTTVPPTTSIVTKSVSSTVNWDAIAECESGGDWHINTGNGYYGGLQFDLDTWKEAGGTGYPHQHSREEQIYRAEITYKKRGLSPWPNCGKHG